MHELIYGRFLVLKTISYEFIRTFYQHFLRKMRLLMNNYFIENESFTRDLQSVTSNEETYLHDLLVILYY